MLFVEHKNDTISLKIQALSHKSTNEISEQSQDPDFREWRLHGLLRNSRLGCCRARPARAHPESSPLTFGGHITYNDVTSGAYAVSLCILFREVLALLKHYERTD